MNEVENAEVYEQVKASFGPNATHYTASQGHGNKTVLEELVAKVNPASSDRVLDIGTGAGHTAIAFAPKVQEVVAFDLTPQMLEETRRNTQAKGITNLRTQQGAAEKLPFEDSSFEIVVCRLTTHHFANLSGALAEMARVLAPGGRLVIVDSSTPEDKKLQEEINHLEKLRDPSHVRSYSGSEWQALIEAPGLGLKVKVVEYSYYDEGGKMEFEVWTTRIGTTAENKAHLRQLFSQARPELVEVLQIEKAGETFRFTIPLILLIVTKSDGLKG